MPNQAHRSTAPIRCLVIQMTRLGDTIQSLMALRAAKHLYPDLEIHFVAREKFAAAAKRVPWIKEVIVFPTEKILGPMLKGEEQDTQALGSIARWVSPLIKDSWDLIVNWSYSESSSFLAGIVPAKVKLGYTRRKDATFACADGWSHYIQAVVQGGIHQNIHLTDILTTQLLTALQIHYGDPVNDGNTPVTSKGFFTLELGERDLEWSKTNVSKKWIALQLGAGNPAKCWPTTSWARFTKYVLDRHPEYGIVLLGGSEDEAKSKEMQAELKRLYEEDGDPSRLKDILSLVGETDFDLWASIVSRCQWVFAGDTAVVHLASVLGTRVVNLSIGPVRYWETGPYGNGHYIVAPNRVCTGCYPTPGVAETVHTCAIDITPEALYAAWTYGATEWVHRRQMTLESHFSQLGWSDRIDSIKVLRAKVRGTQDGGGVVYEPMFKRPILLEDWTSMSMGHIARAWYCGWVPPIGQELSREMISPQLIQKLREIQESSDVLSKICDEAKKTSLNISRVGGNLRSEKVMRIREKEEIQRLGKRLMDLDELIGRLGKTQIPLQAFSQMSKVLMHNLQGAHISELGKESAESYKQIDEGIAILRQWLKHTLNLAKPVAVKSASLSSLESARKPNEKDLSP